MKELIDVFKKSIAVENFSRREAVVYGFVIPLFSVLALIIGSSL